MNTKPTKPTNLGAAPQDPQDSLDQPHFNLGAEGPDSSYGIGNDQSTVLSQTRDETSTEHSDSVSSNTTGCTEASNSESNVSSEAEQIPFPSTLDASPNLGKTHPPNKVDKREVGKVTGKNPDHTQEPESQSGSQIPPSGKVRQSTEASQRSEPNVSSEAEQIPFPSTLDASSNLGKTHPPNKVDNSEVGKVTDKTPDPTQELESQIGSQIPPSGKVRLNTETARGQADPTPHPVRPRTRA